MDRRTFTALLPTLLALDHAAVAKPQFTGPSGQGPKPAQSALKPIPSGTYQPGPGYGSLPNRTSHRYVIGTIKPGDIRLEMHETIQQPGAEHEPVDTHPHSEIWLVQRGTASLFINGTEHRMQAGDIGIVNAGDRHWIKNVGQDELAYFVVTVGGS